MAKRRKTTAKKVKKIRVPRTRAGETWTEARYFQFIRTTLRAASVKWQPIVQCALNARRKYTGQNKAQKWEYQCAVCGRWFLRTKMQVDHIEPCGSIKSYEDIGPFCQRLFCEIDGLRMLCGECDDVNTRPREE